MLHRVESEPSVLTGMLDISTSPGALRDYLEERRDWARLSPVDLLLAASGQVERNGFILTVDDGYVDFLTTTVPILEEYEAHALLFVTTGFIDRSAMPYEEQIAAWIMRSDKVVFPGKGEMIIGSLDDKVRAYRSIREAIKFSSYSARMTRLQEVCDANGWQMEGSLCDKFLTWEQLRELDRHPLVTVGGHSHSHVVLSAIRPFDVFREARLCKARLMDELRHDVDWFSYTYGVHSWVARRCVGLAGFRYAMATTPRPYSNGAVHPLLALPRYDFSLLSSKR